MKIIGISGTNGSGKDTLGEILARDYGWYFVSVSELLRNEVRARGLPVERENLRKVSAEWRRQDGVGVLMHKAVQDFEKQGNRYAGLVISNLRNPGEADAVHGLGGKVIWLDADANLRYERIFKRGRSTEDKKTFEQFLKEETDEMRHGGDDHGLHMEGVRAKADIFINTHSNDLELFKRSVESALADLL